MHGASSSISLTWRNVDETTNVLQQILGYVQKNPNGLDKLAPAYVAAWGELPAVVAKDASNPHFGNDYATLEATLKLIKPVFAKHGLALLQSSGRIADGNIDVVSLLLHSSGQQIALTTQMPLGGKLTSQAAGSATTYGKRYMAKGIAGLADSDDDGEAASQPSTPPKKAAAKSKAPAKTEEPEESYAETVEALMTDIAEFTGTADEMEKQLRPRVEELVDDKVNRAYVEKRTAIRKGGKK